MSKNTEEAVEAEARASSSNGPPAVCCVAAEACSFKKSLPSAAADCEAPEP